MYIVYWTVSRQAHPEPARLAWKELTNQELDPTVIEYRPHSKWFPATGLTLALAFSEDLRRQRREGTPIMMITMASEDPNSVGEQGVGTKLPAGYDWTKRRSTLIRTNE